MPIRVFYNLYIIIYFIYIYHKKNVKKIKEKWNN